MHLIRGIIDLVEENETLKQEIEDLKYRLRHEEKHKLAYFTYDPIIFHLAAILHDNQNNMVIDTNYIPLIGNPANTVAEAFRLVNAKHANEAVKFSNTFIL